MKLENKINLCYISTEDLFEWIKKNNLFLNNFEKERKIWKEEITKSPNYFSDTELLLIHENYCLLKAINDSQKDFLAKTYKLEYQETIQKLFFKKKNLIIISDRQWKDKVKDETVIILFENEEKIKLNLENWLKKLSDEDH